MDIRYSREVLSFSDKEIDKNHYKEVVQNLLNKSFSNKDISLAEEQFICGVIKLLRDEKNELRYNLKDVVFCKNYMFRHLYIIYFNDLNGNKDVYDANGLIRIYQKREDVDFLNKEYIDWNNKMENKQNGNELINFISKETNEQLKDLKSFSKRNFLGSNYMNYLKKSLTLHSKYIYLIVKEFFQENNFKQLEYIISNEKIIIDAYSYVHILFRHFAEGIKKHQNKSYHFDQDVNFKNIPTVLGKIIECYKSNIDEKQFNKQYIFFTLNDIKYAMWFKKTSIYLKGNIKNEFLRIQTFYPIVENRDLNKIELMRLIETNCGYNFYI